MRRLDESVEPYNADLSIVVPCYNEEESLPVFYENVSEILHGIGCTYKLLLIDDGSRDKTLDVMRALSERDKNVEYYSLSRNFGKESAMYAGLSHAKGNYVAVMDADMQDPPSLLPEMISILDRGEYDSVATRRATRKGEPVIRSWFAKQFYKIINSISDAEIVDGARDFRLMTRKMVNAVLSMSEYNRFSKGIFGWVGFRTYWLSYDNIERVAGNTKWSFRKLFRYALDGIVIFSDTPIRIIPVVGIVMLILSLLLMVVLGNALSDTVSPWQYLPICISLLIGGVQLFFIGVIGYYVAKIYGEVKHRPHYIIKETNMDM